MHQFLDKKQIVKRRKNIRNIILFGFFFLLFILGGLSWTGQFSNYIGRPIWSMEQFIIKSFNNINFLFHTKATLSSENEKLIEENLNINLSMIDYKILENENKELKEMLGRISANNNFILGNILTKPSHSLYDTIIIDIGENLDIKSGDKVYALGNIPIGNISKVYNNTSLVTLYTNPGQKTEGYVDGLNASVELIGRGGGNFEMIIPLDLSVISGTIIYLPGNVSEVLAQVNEIISNQSDPFKKVILSSPVNIQNIKWVEVKKN